MTKKRQELFESDRQKMLASIGLEPEESFVTEKEEPEEESQDQKDFSETLEDLKIGNPSATEYEARVNAACEDFCDFENSLMDKNEEERKTARKARHNQHIRAKEKFKERGAVNAHGGIIKALDKFQATCGGGPIYMAYVVLVCSPLFTYWTEKANVIMALFVFGVSMFVGRLATMWISYLVIPIVHIAEAIGPRFICEIRKGSLADKMKVSLQTKSMIIFANIHYPLFGFLFLILFKIHKGEDVWIYNYFHNLGYALFVTAIAWIFSNFIVYPVYVGYIKDILATNNKTIYLLRYLDDRKRVMIAPRSGPLVDKKEIRRAFQRDGAGIA